MQAKKSQKLINILRILSIFFVIAAFVFLGLYLFQKKQLSQTEVNLSNDVVELQARIDDFATASQDKSLPTLFIPKLNLIEEIHIGASESELEKGVWMKFSEERDPEKGGNVVLTGHRYRFEINVREAIRKSPFYNIDKLENGDIIILKWNEKFYEYSITETKKVNPDEILIEQNTSNHMLTLYTCTLGGRYDGREVLIAKPHAEN